MCLRVLTITHIVQEMHSNFRMISAWSVSTIFPAWWDTSLHTKLHLIAREHSKEKKKRFSALYNFHRANTSSIGRACSGGSIRKKWVNCRNAALLHRIAFFGMEFTEYSTNKMLKKLKKKEKRKKQEKNCSIAIRIFLPRFESSRPALFVADRTALRICITRLGNREW